MNRKRSCLLGLSVFAVTLGGEPAYAGKKVTLCHAPPGSPANAHTISVGEAAITAHLGHGDQLSECPSRCQVDASVCDDGNACTSDSCGVDGECRHAAVSCDDGNACTADLCDPSAGCLSVANDGARCDDGNACSDQDACVGTSCRGTAIAGCCETSADCYDADACTDDACTDGHCANWPRDCSVADKCTAGFCDAITGECGITAVSCSDGNVCTDDFCDAVMGCFSRPTANPPEAFETSCADGADNDCDGLVDSADADCVPVCGNGVLEPGEECDDGNLVSFDGCSGVCLIEGNGGGD